MTILAAVVFGLGLGGHAIGRDEAVSVLLVRHGLDRLLPLLAAHEVHPAGYFLFLWAWPHGTPIEARLLSWLPAVVTVPLVALAARRAGLSPLAGGLLAATSPFLAYYSAEARMYSWLALFGAAALLAVLSLPTRPGRAWGFGLGALLAAGLYIHYYAAFTALAVLAVLLVRRHLATAALTVATAGVAFLPGLVLLAYQVPVFLRYPAEPWQQRIDLGGLYAVAGLLFGGSEYYEPGRRVALLLALPALYGLTRLPREIRLLAAAGIGLPLVLGVFTTSLSARYLAAGVPVLLLALAAAAAAVPVRVRAVGLGILVALSLGLVANGDLRYDSLKPPTPEFIAAARQADAVLVIGHRHFAPQAAFYAPGAEAFSFPPPPVDHVGLWSIPATAPYPPATGARILLVDYCWDAGHLPSGYRATVIKRYPEGDLCLSLAVPGG
ncbi:MAG: hypothetical protein NVS9B1_04770 [Candidatus Dormibacteraceae bacterium]